MDFVGWLAKLWEWEVSVDVKDEVDVIAPLSYGARPDGRLANGTAEAMALAIACQKEFPKTIIAFGNAPHCFPGAEMVESRLKKELLLQAGVASVLETRPVFNSVDEAYAVRERLNRAGIHPECIIVIAGQFHSRGARLIWKKVFPESTIVLRTFSYRLEYQADHPVFMQRGVKRWVAANLLRQIMLILLGLRITGRITHSSSLFPKILRR